MQEVSRITFFIVFTTILVLTLISFIITVLFLYRKKQIAYEKTLKDTKNDYDRNLLRSQIEVHEQTLNEISREIHDNIGLSLTLAKLNLNTMMRHGHQDMYCGMVNSSVDLITKAIQDLSDLSKSLKGEIITNHGLIKAVEMEIEKLRRLETYQIMYSVNGDPIFMESQKELVLFRIIQEALNNILKHANARSINISLDYRRDYVNVTIQDDGKGFDLKEIENIRGGRTSGLLNMSHRSKLLSGSCIIESNENLGTTIKVAAPFKTQQDVQRSDPSWVGG